MAERLVLGPLVGGLSHDRVNLWARASGPGMLHAWVGRQADLSDARLAGAALLVASSGFAGRVAVTGLRPETTYHYALTLTDTPPRPTAGAFPSFTTAPQPGEPRDFAFAFGSCFRPGVSNNGQTLRHLDGLRQALDLRFVLLLGDQIYADEWNGNGLGYVALTEEDYRAVYRHVWGHPAWRNLMQRLPVFMILDDHEVDDDWAWTSPERYEGRIPPWHPIIRWFKGFPPEARRLSHRRIQAAIQAYWEHQAMHGPPLLLPPDGIAHDRPLLLPADQGSFAYTFTYGPAAFFVLDTRTQRVYKQRLLNRAQWEALENWLLQVKDRFPLKFIVSSISVLFEMWGDFTRDRWNGYPDERRRLLHLLAAHKAHNTFILTGDLHSAHAVEATLRAPDGELLTVWEFCSSPFEQMLNKPALFAARHVHTPPLVGHRIHFRLAEPNVGVVQVRFENGAPRLTFSIYDDRTPEPRYQVHPAR